MSDAVVLFDALGRLLESIEDAEPATQWAHVEESGFLDALMPVHAGGAGLSLAEAAPLIRLSGYYALDQSIGTAMALRAIGSSSLPGLLAAVVAATEIAGAAERVLVLTIEHANVRSQFGKPIARQQALQQQIAVLGEQVLMARIAAQIGCSGGLDPSMFASAVAKAVASATVPTVTSIAHAVHGAIGMTSEHRLHRFTRKLHELRGAFGSESVWNEHLGRARLDGIATTLEMLRLS